MGEEEALSNGGVDNLLVEEAVATIELPIHVTLGLALLGVVAELLHSLLEAHLVAVDQSQHAVGQVLGLLVRAGDTAAGIAVEDIDDAGAEAVGTHGAGHHFGHHPLVADHLGLQHGAGRSGGNLLVKGSLEGRSLHIRGVIAAVRLGVDKEGHFVLGHGLELVPHLLHIVLDVGQVLSGRIDGEGNELKLAHLFLHAELGAVLIVVSLEIGIADDGLFVSHTAVRQGGHTDVGGLAAVGGYLLVDGLGHVEALADKAVVFLLFAVASHILLQLDPLHAAHGVEVVEVVNPIVHLLDVETAGLRVGKRLTHGGVDEHAGIHVAQLGSRNGEAELRGLLLHEGLVDKLLPHHLANLGLHFRRNLRGLLLHLVVVLHLTHQLVEALRSHGGGVDFAHVGDTAAVLGQVAEDKSQNSDTNDSNCYPRMFSDTSNDCHFL